MKYADFPVGEIVVANRTRKELGELLNLTCSIERVGLLHPVVLNAKHELIAGGRRLAAVKKLGWETIPTVIVDNLEDAILALAAERDEFREAFMRVKADFENYRKRSDKNLAERVERATGQLVTQLLPVLDACDAAVGQGLAEIEPIQKSFLDLLEREGLERLDPVGEVFDPNLHEAVMHEEGEAGEEPTVMASLRTGYAWKGKVIRPAMVKVKG